VLWLNYLTTVTVWSNFVVVFMFARSGNKPMTPKPSNGHNSHNNLWPGKPSSNHQQHNEEGREGENEPPGHPTVVLMPPPPANIDIFQAEREGGEYTHLSNT
jgi:hypothetical protein